MKTQLVLHGRIRCRRGGSWQLLRGQCPEAKRRAPCHGAAHPDPTLALTSVTGHAGLRHGPAEREGAVREQQWLGEQPRKRERGAAFTAGTAAARGPWDRAAAL